MVKQVVLHSLDKIFWPLAPNDNPYQQEPASITKLKKGYATQETRKTMLDWVIDSVQGIIELPLHQIECLHKILAAIRPGQKLVATNVWHQLLGKLPSMAIALPTCPSVIGTCNAAGTGMGGVFFAPTTDDTIFPCWWRNFLHGIQSKLVSFDNPTGTITNSNLELCGNVAHHNAIAQFLDMQERTI